VEEILLLGDALKLMDKWLDTTHRQTERPDGTRTDEWTGRHAHGHTANTETVHLQRKT